MSEDLRRFPGYAICSPPAQLADRTPRDWKPREARDYFDWFVEVVPKRCTELKEVAADIANELDYSPQSLRSLGHWFSSAITARKKSGEEVNRELAGLSERAREMGVDDWTVSGESFSLCVDVGIYLGEVFKKQHSHLDWSLCTRPKSDVSYNQPVLEGGRMKLDPINLVVVLAYGIARGNRGPDDLFEIYTVWAPRVAT